MKISIKYTVYIQSIVFLEDENVKCVSCVVQSGVGVKWKDWIQMQNQCYSYGSFSFDIL